MALSRQQTRKRIPMFHARSNKASSSPSHPSPLNRHRSSALLAMVVLAGIALVINVSQVHAQDGIVDASFGTSGKQTTSFSSTGTKWDDPYAAAVGPDGSIFVVGTSENPTNTSGYSWDFAIAKFTPAGTLDTTFDSDGKVTTDFGVNIDYAYAIEVYPDGKILVAGEAKTLTQVNGNDATTVNFAVARYSSAGFLDTTFGTAGKVITDFDGGADYGKALSLRPDGSFFVAGTSRNNFALAKYTSAGALDTSFDSDGLVTTDFSAGADNANSIVVNANGSIIVGGIVTVTASGETSANAHFGIAKYTTSGALDSSFGTAGKVTTAFVAGQEDELTGLALATDGKLVAAGKFNSSTGQDFALARYTSSGVLDATFDTDGKVTTDFSGTSGDDGAAAVSVLHDGTILVAGYSTGATRDFALAKYTSAGVLDATFDSDGKATVDVGGAEDVGQAMTISSNGSIFVAGRAIMGAAGNDFAIAKFVGSTPVTTTTTSTTSSTSTTVAATPDTSAATTTVAAVSATTAPSSTSTTVPAPAESVILDLPTPTTPLLTDTTLEVGQPVFLEFGGFVPGEFVQLIVASTPRVIGSGYANSLGFVRLSGDLPANLLAGKHSLALYAPESGRGVRQPIVVEAPVRAKNLPATGGTRGVTLPIFFVMLGLTILLLSRFRIFGKRVAKF
jgi:uncharacterized delta-60 repeat protein